MKWGSGSLTIAGNLEVEMNRIYDTRIGGLNHLKYFYKMGHWAYLPAPFPSGI